MSLMDILGDGGERASRINGVVTGVVTNNQDPQSLGRVKVRFPWLSGGDESWWARLAVPMAGPNAGTCFLPDVDDEVLVAFEHGDVRFPYVLGSLWRDGAPPPETNADGKNARRTIRSPAGLAVTLDDSAGAEAIVVTDEKGAVVLTLDAAKQAITIEAKSGVTVKAPGGKVVVDATSVEITSSTSIKVKASATLDLEGAVVNVKGNLVNLG